MKVYDPALDFGMIEFMIGMICMIILIIWDIYGTPL